MTKGGDRGRSIRASLSHTCRKVVPTVLNKEKKFLGREKDLSLLEMGLGVGRSLLIRIRGSKLPAVQVGGTENAQRSVISD